MGNLKPKIKTMSTIPKEIEDAARKYCNDTGLGGWGKAITMSAFITGYQLATDGREELEKENHELLLQVLHYQQIGLKNLETITALQSSLKDVEKDNEILKQRNSILFKDGQEQLDKMQTLISSLKEKEKRINELELGVTRMHENMLLGNHVEANRIGLDLLKK